MADPDVSGVRAAAGAQVVAVSECPQCTRQARELAEARQMVASVTWSLMAAVVWGGKQLEQETVDRQRVAEELLDRIGAVLATVTENRRPSPGSPEGGPR